MARLIHQWSHLPEELLSIITKLAGNREEDTLRIRSVCSSWRSFIAPPPMCKKLLFPLMLPLLNPRHAPDVYGYLKLTSMTIYRLDLPSCKESQHRRNWCLIRLQQTDSGNFQVFNPFGGRVELSPSFPQLNSNVINSLAFYKSQITNSYHLSMERGPLGNAILDSADNNAYKFIKVIVSSKPVTFAGQDYLVIALTSKGVLYHMKLGDDRWSTLDHYYELLNFVACDILEYNGHFFLACKERITVIMNYSLQVLQVIPFLNRGHGESSCYLNLVESKGALFLVQKHWYKYMETIDKSLEIEVYIFMHGLNEWKASKHLGDNVLFLCHDCCFSISAEDFPALKGNCVYFMHDSSWEFANDAICKGLKDFTIYVYDLEDGSIGPLLSHPGNSSILWSIPSSDAN
ncbi:hypothetical protein ACFE04_013957 [Oxalis oulophora]